MTKFMSISKLPAVVVVAVAVCLGAAACGTADPGMTGAGGTGPGTGGTGPGTGGTGPGTGGSTGGSTDPSQQFLPIKTGNTWTYLVTDTVEGITPKTQTVMEAGPVGGTGPNAAVTAYRFVTRKGTDLSDETVSWQARVGTRVVRYREQAFSKTEPGKLELEEHWAPYKLRVDESPEHTTVGAIWTETDQETNIPVGGTSSTVAVTEQWKVATDRLAVTVLGKSYEVMIVTKTSNPTGDMPATKTYWWARGIGKVKEIGANQTEELMSYQLAP
jgi:hypothetical protein